MPTKIREDASRASFYDGTVKSVVVIGNGPSAITLSYLLAGNVPFYKGGAEDAHLHRRLEHNRSETIVLQDLEHLATGCEGRSNNPVSVFFDMLNHPDADSGIEKESLLEWRRRSDLQVEHVIIGKGKPGGCWESLEGNVQTVSLGNWMELPNLTMSQANSCRSDSKMRVKVANVAKYYQEYVRKMNLENYFLNHSEVTSVREITELFCSKLKQDVHSVPNLTQYCEENAIFGTESLYNNLPESSSVEIEVCCCSSEEESGASLTDTNASSAICSFSSQKEVGETMENSTSSNNARSALSTTPHGLNIQKRHRSQSSQSLMDRCSYFDECCASTGELEEFALNSCCSWNPIVNPDLFCSTCTSGYEYFPRSRAYTWSATLGCKRKCDVATFFPNTDRLFEVTGFTLQHVNGSVTSRSFKFLTKQVVLATGSYDFPNRLNVQGENLPHVLHSLIELEEVISRGILTSTSDPIMIVGAGLSAADAIVTARNEGIPVAHTFRRSVEDPSLIFKMLPKALYPEYHKVYSLMKGELKCQGYVPMAEHHIMEILPNKKVVLHVGDLKKTISVSYVVILIGSSPDLDFLEPKLRSNLGIIKSEPISRSNPIDIDLFTNEAVDVPGVYAMGPLVGDNFVRFLQGGALAIASHVLRKEKPLAAKT